MQEEGLPCSYGAWKRKYNLLIQPHALPSNPLLFPAQVDLIEDHDIDNVHAECRNEQVGGKGWSHNKRDWQDER